MPLDSGVLIEAVAMTAGVAVGGFAASYLPTFSYSNLVYSVVGVLLIAVAFGYVDHDGAAFFVAGVGASWTVQLVGGLQSILKLGTSAASSGSS